MVLIRRLLVVFFWIGMLIPQAGLAASHPGDLMVTQEVSPRQERRWQRLERKLIRKANRRKPGRGLAITGIVFMLIGAGLFLLLALSMGPGGWFLWGGGILFLLLGAVLFIAGLSQSSNER